MEEAKKLSNKERDLQWQTNKPKDSVGEENSRYDGRRRGGNKKKWDRREGESLCDRGIGIKMEEKGYGGGKFRDRK